MRYLYCFIVSILLSLPVTAENAVLKKAELRVLDIGNSYTTGATRLLPLITTASKTDLSTMCLYQCYRSGASFKNWVDIYNDKDTTKTYSITKVVGGLSANVQTGKGEAGDGRLFRDVLTNEKWDLIIIHQYSRYAPYYSKWNSNSSAGYLDELISVIKEHQPNAELGFLLVHSYWSGYERNTEQSSYDRWQLIANSAKSFCEDYDVDFVIPYGTAIQNLRLSSLNNEYDLTSDGTHCGYGLAEYTAACCYYESLIAPRCGISAVGNSARIDVSDKESKYPSVNVTDENALIAQVAAYLATKDMYHCQNPEDSIFKLVYELDGEVYKSADVPYGMDIIPESVPEKEGYSFSGWSDIPETMPANDVTVTGNFTVNGDCKEISRTIVLQGGDLYNNGNVKRITTSREEYLKYLNTPVFLNALEIKTVDSIEQGENIKFYCYTEDFKFIGTTTQYKLLEGTVWIKIKLENDHKYIGTKPLNITYVTKGLPDTKNTYSSLSRLTFSYEVFDNIGSTEPSINENERHFDNGMIILPPNYSNTGDPVRLVIFAHGTGGFSWKSSGSYKDLLEFVAKNGYAVCDCCGMSDKYSIGELAPPISDARHNLMSISCYCSMYEFLMKNFNLKDDGCFMFGKSNGGIVTTYMTQTQPIPIITSAGLSPSISIIESLRYTRGGSLQYWTDRLGLNVDCSNVAEKTRLYEVESSNQDIINYLKSHANVFADIDPFIMQTDIDANKIAKAFFSKPYLKANENIEVENIISNTKKRQTCPMIIFHALDDRAVPYEISKWYVEMCRKTDSPCFLRTIPSGLGGHHAVDTDVKAPQVTFSTKYGETVQIVEAYKELVEWFNMYECQNPESYTYKLIYKINEEVYKSMDVAYGSKITPEAAPKKEGYSFSGWSEIPNTMPPMDVTVTGTFSINIYKLTYIVDGEAYKTYDIEYGTAITPATEPSKEGYTFSGWSDIPKTMPARDVTVTGSFTQIEYRVGDDTYDITGERTVTIKGSNQTGSLEISGVVEINGRIYQVTAIGENAFKDNTKITSVTIDNGIKTIGDNAFSGCINLIVINIGKDVNAIGHQAFADVGNTSYAHTRSNEASIIVNCCAESVPVSATDAFENTQIDTGLLLVEDNSVVAYKTSSPWNGFGKILGFKESTDNIFLINILPGTLVYDMLGRRINHLQKGLNILHRSDSKTQKIITN